MQIFSSDYSSLIFNVFHHEHLTLDFSVKYTKNRRYVSRNQLIESGLKNMDGYLPGLRLTYINQFCELESHSDDTTLCDKVCQWLATCRWFSVGTPVIHTNKTDRHDITEILLKVALNTINQPINLSYNISQTMKKTL